ncbi:9882_t:CDS:2 [Ambispora gerdemannii]|uniref:9882_t:CDS:1 n=1 Tax=Ambispora gerdemannii TaxID=144530 RepID=A0A9N8Z928_9GLOM|nr:9882_t:CDS:2 [Ambispora gerdemannii]
MGLLLRVCKPSYHRYAIDATSQVITESDSLPETVIYFEKATTEYPVRDYLSPPSSFFGVDSDSELKSDDGDRIPILQQQSLLEQQYTQQIEDEERARRRRQLVRERRRRLLERRRRLRERRRRLRERRRRLQRGQTGI